MLSGPITFRSYVGKNELNTGGYWIEFLWCLRQKSPCWSEGYFWITVWWKSPDSPRFPEINLVWPRNLSIIHIHEGHAPSKLCYFCGLDVSSTKCCGQHCNRPVVSLLLESSLGQWLLDLAPELLPHASRWSWDVICRRGVLELDGSTSGGGEPGTFVPSVPSCGEMSVAPKEKPLPLERTHLLGEVLEPRKLLSRLKPSSRNWRSSAVDCDCRS